MTVKKSGLFWGVLLIAAGALALLQQMGYLQRFPEQAWTWVFVFISLLGLASYALSGWTQWGWLFPTGVFGGLAATISLATSHPGIGAVVATPLFIGLLVPFAVAYFVDRARNWWALIPGGVMLFLALTTLLVDSAGGEWVGTLFLWLIALGFLGAYISKRTRTWALLVAYITAVLGIAPAMASSEAVGPYYGVVFMLAIAAPFFVVYFRRPGRWWAIIPASAMSLIAVIVVAGIAGWIRTENEGGYVSAFLMAGLAGAFAVIWLRHGKSWAKIVTIVLGALAVAAVLFAAHSAVLWPVAIILVGLYLLYSSMRTKAA